MPAAARVGGVGDGDCDGVREAVGETEGVPDAVGDTEGVSVGEGVAVAEGVSDVVGDAVGVTLSETTLGAAENEEDADAEPVEDGDADGHADTLFDDVAVAFPEAEGELEGSVVCVETPGAPGAQEQEATPPGEGAAAGPP